MNENDKAEGRDRLTGLIGADAACAQIAGWQSAAIAAGEKPAVHAMMLGLRRFETVNRAFGEAVGNQALAEVAARLLFFAKTEMVDDWLVACMGEGMFLVAANKHCSRERWHWLAEELSQSLMVPIRSRQTGGGTVRLWPRAALLRAMSDEQPERMLDRLSRTLESVKRDQAQRLVWVDGDLRISGRTTSQLEADLLAAIDRDEIEILFQPQYDCASGRIVGAEALARWQHPELGRIGAGALFSIAERADHVGQLSYHIAGAALTAAASWPDHLRLSLNVTAADLGTGNFATATGLLLHQTGFPPEQLTLEITEQLLVTELDRSAERLQTLVDRGVRIALDDFGAGFSNFRYLKSLPLQYLKLDRSMVDGIADQPRDLAVFRGILAMASALDLQVIAEGVESEAQREVVAREGCSVWQGFLGSTPLSAADFAALVARS
ncbi:EAL domain-containing protein (putative c-di-GMP-specific phosphodiesterase class I)/GGDEF domain-containing protein [Altererythrobacter atlanticus]|nr:GGDEF domain-containing phosphodiesterase [Croceibacterium atlanticum]MBB5733211.1 EAL domain-containing protein (putative c-di-GMP-specific phosphodiesterase class I)/GGDEF domain-containing protein [Croceibacterium atlanticum]